jgi:putative molybdopterin biosynthesis protein
MAAQEQFLEVIDRDEAERRFRAAICTEPLGEESVTLHEALGRVLSRDVTAPIDVPSFDRSNYDGYAVQAADTYEATESDPHTLRLLAGVLAAGVVPQTEVEPGTAVGIATGGMLPRGADAVVMVEHTDEEGSQLLVRRPVTPGHGVSFAGTDIGAGETVVRRGEVLTSRETGVLAALGLDTVVVWRRPRVAIISTGDEIIPPGQPMSPGKVYDSNARIVADAVRELGGHPVEGGIVPDDLALLRDRVRSALEASDVILLSGGTSKGQGDLSYRVVSELDEPGIVAHGVALKPGKPICLAASREKPIVILPGFPTSAIFTFHEFVAPVIRLLGGRPAESHTTVPARLAVKINSVIGRTEYMLVGLVERTDNHADQVSLSAFPMGKGSGSVTTFSRADGFITVPRYQEIVQAGSVVDVQLIGRDVRLADLVVIGSHCVGLDFLLGRLQERGFQTKFLAVGSTAGLDAARRGECDVAGIHLLEPNSGQYNRPFVTDDLQLVAGYGRMQGVVFRRGDSRFEGRDARQAVADASGDNSCMMVNRNQGSGTRILIDGLLGQARPPGYAVQARSHNAVAAAVTQKRADWGVAIARVADQAGLGFLALTHEQYDFVVPKSRSERPAVQGFQRLLGDGEVRKHLADMGFMLPRSESSSSGG